MNKRIILLAIVLGFLPFLALVYSAHHVGAGDIVFHKTDLADKGVAYEINPDLEGHLWISDYSANEIRHFNPATNVYTSYLGLNGPSDARLDDMGNVWWTDFDNNLLGRISLNTYIVTTWPLTGTGIAWGTALDSDGKVWITDSVDPYVYRFDPNTSELCFYTMPDDGASEYIVIGGGDIWLGDSVNERIVRLNPVGALFTWWQLESGAYPRGLATTEDGYLWWADNGLGVLAELQPDINQMTSYTLPVGSEPVMISYDEQRLWYSEIADFTFGVLDPLTADSWSTTLAKSTQAAGTPDCTTPVPDSATSVITSTGTASWVQESYTATVDSDGWTIYELPPAGSPWGITADSDKVWVVDNGRNELLRMVDTNLVYVPLVIK